MAKARTKPRGDYTKIHEITGKRLVHCSRNTPLLCWKGRGKMKINKMEKPRTKTKRNTRVHAHARTHARTHRTHATHTHTHTRIRQNKTNFKGIIPISEARKSSVLFYKKGELMTGLIFQLRGSKFLNPNL